MRGMREDSNLAQRQVSIHSVLGLRQVAVRQRAHLARAQAFTLAAAQNNTPTRYSHAQNSPKPGNCRSQQHASTAVKKLRRSTRAGTRTRPSSYKWAPFRDFLRRSHRLVVRARRGTRCRVETGRDNKERAASVRCVCAYWVLFAESFILARRSRPSNMGANAFLALVELLKCPGRTSSAPHFYHVDGQFSSPLTGERQGCPHYAERAYQMIR